MNRRNGVIAGVLAIALLIVLVLWMRDRESQDLKIDLDIGAAAGTTDGAIVAVPRTGGTRGVLLSNDDSARYLAWQGVGSSRLQTAGRGEAEALESNQTRT